MKENNVNQEVGKEVKEETRDDCQELKKIKKGPAKWFEDHKGGIKKWAKRLGLVAAIGGVGYLVGKHNGYNQCLDDGDCEEDTPVDNSQSTDEVIQSSDMTE